jgi:predicted NUDIX family NTP pyrophosphohydrolase
LTPKSSLDSLWNMKEVSAGLLMYRRSKHGVEVLLVHPGGPYWVRKDQGVWSIPKGVVGENEDKLSAAQREFTEETSFSACGPFIDLGQVRQKSGKQVYGWAFEGDCEVSQLKSNSFTLEWPPKSGQMKEFPEVDRGEFFSLPAARAKINPQQFAFLERLEIWLGT